MSGNTSVRRAYVTVPAGGRKVFEGVGEFLFVEYASADCTARLEGERGTIAENVLIRSSASYTRFPRLYSKIVFENTGGVDVALIIIYGEGEFSLNLLSGDVTVSTPTSLATDFDDQTIAAGASYDIAADATRVELILEAAENNTDYVRVRETDAVTDRGMRLKPGERIFLRCAGAVRVRNNSADPQTISIAEVKR